MNLRKMLANAFLLGALVIGLATSGRATSITTHSSDFSVEFTDCVESIGVGLVPTASARVYVPLPFILVGEGQPVTPLVVRTARCRSIRVDGHTAKPGEIVQIGAVIVPPDGTGDINNYTIWYYTSDVRLARHLGRAGVIAQHVPAIEYDYNANAGNAFH